MSDFAHIPADWPPRRPAVSRQPDPETQLQILDHSMRCFGWGLASLVPVLGLIGAPVAIYHYVRIRRAVALWPADPARHYRRAGLTCLILGTIFSMLVSAAFSYPLIRRILDSW
jgi:hypothetical protein